MSSVLCCKRVFILHRSVLCSENLVISRVEKTYQEPQSRLPFRMLVVLDKVVLKDLTCGIKFWTLHSENQLLAENLRRLVSNWQPTTADSEKEGAVFSRRGHEWHRGIGAPSPVLGRWFADSDGHDQCCGGFGYAMEGEKLENRCWTLHWLQPGQTIEIVSKRGRNTSGTWRRAWTRWAHGWIVVAVLNQVCGTGFRKATLFLFEKGSLLWPQDFGLQAHFSILFYLRAHLCSMVQEKGLLHKVCSNRCVLGSCVNYAESFASEDDQMRAGFII